MRDNVSPLCDNMTSDRSPRLTAYVGPTNSETVNDGRNGVEEAGEEVEAEVAVAAGDETALGSEGLGHVLHPPSRGRREEVEALTAGERRRLA